MSMKPWVLGGIGALVLAGLSAGPAFAQQPAPAKTDAPVCADCHDQAKAFAGNPHTRIPGVAWGKAGVDSAACNSCHGPGVKHMESSGEDKSDIRAFHGRKGAEFCVTCHTSDKEHASFQTGVHASTEAVNCLSCHSVHSPEARTPHLLAKKPSELCASCHPSQMASFRNKPFAHRLGRGGMECTSCHEPHGSSNNKRLIRARVDRLCLECHSFGTGSTLTTATLGSQPPSFHNVSLPRYQNCTTCHTAVHGSQISPLL